MNRNSMFAANWKMNLPNDGLESYIGKMDTMQNNKIEVVLAVPAPYLFQANNIVKKLGSNIKIAAQNMCYKERGAYTGEVSVAMLQDLDVNYVVLGHSERRHIFNETDDDICEKVKLANKYKLHTILCVGETLQERDQAKTFEILQNQLEALKTLQDLQNITIAYEPVWAIGTGISASPNQIQPVHAFIRSWIRDNFSGGAADSILIIYGGSVKPGNIRVITSQKDVDGGLVGSASLTGDTFTQIISNANK